ncbi:helicase-related protein [Methanocella conradii]|uniref:helicase-related protein n=1 Tax=Methanocella conradii TaxID=1175444 RepID=UPI0024B34A51|nr:helicase-related protein [Methanocella conradii]MDI6895762.1 helicase-related protein [Methanocella conradii]
MVQIQQGNILKSSFWPEKVRVISVKNIGERIKIEAVGLETRTFYDPILSLDDVKNIEVIEEKPFKFTGNGESLFLYLEAHRIRNAFQFDPLYAISVSQINPLPHQIEAVYHYILQNPRIRFLLADDPGAGKTIMAGLLLKELKYRGLVDRTLIVAPGHLKDQWLREMKDKFQESFTILDRSVMNANWGRNIFMDISQAIVSLDFAKQDDVMYALKDSKWDLVIVDEAHKMSAYKYGENIKQTQRYNLGELLSSITNYLLFLTATPHRGDPENFRLLLDLLEPGFFANTSMLSESIQNHDNPLFLRRLKEDLKDFDKAPIFPPRKVETIRYYLSEDEKLLYNAVTEYVQKYFNKALEKEKRNVTFALTVLQRRLASSARAIRKSLERRHSKLLELYKKGNLIQEASVDEDALDDLEEKERWKKEEELMEKLTSAETLEELKEEIEKVEGLVERAREVERKEIETKLNELKKVMDAENLKKTSTKLLIFTESKDTLEYLVEKLRKWGYSVAFIHGGMSLDERIKAEAEFKNRAQIMVSTEAGGEGINLQFCWVMVNYDIPWNPNRLEQRMGRIHRYGQRHEVHIYNLVAIDTREGRILDKLFEKLSNIKEHLGSDRVFDVIGEVLAGKSLKDLIVDAITNRRTMDDILKDFEGTPDEEAIKKVREASLEALATRHIDLNKILGEQQKAKENRLVPEYVEEFFKRAARALGIKMEKRQDGFWRISSIPLEIRNQPYDFKAKFGEVQREYARVSFDKEKAFKGQAEFVAMGHPLLEAVVSTILSRYASCAADGATFVDPDGKREGIIWFLQAEIKDGKNEVAGKRLFAVYQGKNNSLSLLNPAVLWDLKPVAEKAAEMPVDKDFIINFVITNGLEDYKWELLERRLRDAGIKKKYGIRSIESLIMESEGKISEYETRRMKGEAIPDATIQNEKRRREDLDLKKARLQREIEAEVHLYPGEPAILGAVRVMAGKASSEMASDEEVEQIGMRVAMDYEKGHNRAPEDVSLLNLGYDIRSYGDVVRYIEVKARARDGAVALTPNEWLMAQRLKEEYWLYVVTNAASSPELYLIQNPAARLEPDKEIDIVRYVVKNWKEKAEMAK